MEQQSAVEFLMKFCLNDLPIEQWNKYNGLFQQAKQMEKEQISKAWDDGDYAYFYSKETGRDFDNGEEYYNEKFKTK